MEAYKEAERPCGALRVDRSLPTPKLSNILRSAGIKFRLYILPGLGAHNALECEKGPSKAVATVVAPTASESNTIGRYVGRFCLSRHLGRRFSKTRDGFGMMGVATEEQEVEDAKRQDTYLLLMMNVRCI